MSTTSSGLERDLVVRAEVFLEVLEFVPRRLSLERPECSQAEVGRQAGGMVWGRKGD
jgi:hypothetical protein